MKTDPGTYAFIFKSPSTYSILSITTGKVIRASGPYTSGVPIVMGGTGIRITVTDADTAADLRAQTGDSIIVAPGIFANVGTAPVLSLRPFSYGTHYASDDGIVFAVRRDNDSSSSLISYADSFLVSTQPVQVRNDITNAELENVKVVPNPYLIGSLYETGIWRPAPGTDPRAEVQPSPRPLHDHHLQHGR